MKKLPNKVRILHIEYKVIYVDNPCKVDLTERKALWGQIDYWTRTIRIYNKDRTYEDILQNIFHECVHAIVRQQRIYDLKPDDEHFVDLFSMGMLSLFKDNKFF